MPIAREPRPSPLWLTEQDVGASLDLNEAIEALETGVREEAKGQAHNLDKVLGTWGKGSAMHALSSLMPDRGYAGFKTWALTPSGAAAVFSLFNTGDGRLLALIEAGLLGAMRTSAMSGLATRTLADPDADEMAIIGTGRQAMLQVASIAVTRKLRRLRVWSPTPENRAKFVEQARKLFPFEVDDAATLRAAVADMPIVTVITRATVPFLDAGVLARGAHVNAAGAILPANAELLPNVFDRASLIVVDSINNARKGSKELRDRFGDDADGWTKVKTLGDMLLSGEGRPSDTDLTVFKPMGMGLSDLSVAAAIFQKAEAAGAGQRLPAAHIPAPRWTIAA